MERDLAAIKAKLASLESEASKIEGTHPEEAEVVIERITKLSQSWEQLTAMLTVRDAKLEEAGDLHRFLKDLDHFQVQFPLRFYSKLLIQGYQKKPKLWFCKIDIGCFQLLFEKL